MKLGHSVMSELALGFGLVFNDLYAATELPRLDRAFLEFLAAADQAVANRLLAARGAPGTIEAKAESDLLLDVAPHLEDFIAALFGIRAEMTALAASYGDLAPLYTCKRLFVQRRVAKAFKPEQAAQLDGPVLTTALEARLGAGFDELAFARRVATWSEAEADHAEELALAERYAAWALHTPEGRAKHGRGILFQVPARTDHSHLVPVETVEIGGVTMMRLPHHHRRLRQGFDLTDQGADLAGSNLRGARLRSADFTGACLRGADFGPSVPGTAESAPSRPADLTGAVLHRAVLADADLGHAILHNADLSEAVLDNANLRCARLNGANLAGARVMGAVFREADLIGVCLGDCDLSGADLTDVRLSKPLDTLALVLQRKIFDHERWIESGGRRGARADLDAADLMRVDLRGVDLSAANLRGACLRQSALSRVRLVMADLSGADLERANLIGAVLLGANLSFANLRGADLTRCELGPAEIRDPASGRATGRSWAASLHGADLRTAQLCGTSLVSANLSDANLEDADLEGADLTGARLPRPRPAGGGAKPGRRAAAAGAE